MSWSLDPLWKTIVRSRTKLSTAKPPLPSHSQPHASVQDAGHPVHVGGAKVHLGQGARNGTGFPSRLPFQECSHAEESALLRDSEGSIGVPITSAGHANFRSASQEAPTSSP